MPTPDPTSRETPWHAAFPAPISTDPASITAAQLLQRFHNSQEPRRDFLLVDLRRTDFEGGTIIGSLNLPAQTVWYSLSTIYALCKHAGIKDVIWYCGSSRGRGTRAACWFADLLAAKGAGVESEGSGMRSLILLGGIKNWATAGEEYVRLMSGYGEGAREYWAQFEATC